ncbi:MAG: hypothetical protein JWO31_2395 [Phycisphaerales bacterium]|nr:hypothetical protein [Phycisphaerales bacterium]
MMSTKRSFAFLSVVLGASAVASAQSAPSIGFFDWDTTDNTGFANFSPTPFLTDSNAAQVASVLSASQAAGKTLAVKITTPLTSTAAKNIFNQFNVKYVFCDFEDTQAVGRTRAIADLVLNSSQSSNAFVGNFNFYPNASNDGTRPTGSTDPTGKAFSFDNKPFSSQYTDSRGKTATKTGKLMANESLYPGSPDFRNPAQGNSNAPNIRSALFTLPILRAGNTTSALPSGDQHIPWVSRFNNYGNSALDSDGNPNNGFVFDATAGSVNAGQLPSRGDFQAQIQHYRLRGATSVNMFEAASNSATQGNGSVLGYTRAQARDDIRTGWSASNVTNQVFARNNYAFANLGSTVNVFPANNNQTPQTVSSESAGVIFSGVYDKAGASGVRALAVLISNMSAVEKWVDLPTIGGLETYNAGAARRDDYLVPAGTHRLLTFQFGTNRWNLTSNSLQFTDANRNGVGVPEPTTAALLGVGAVGLLVRRRRTA